MFGLFKPSPLDERERTYNENAAKANEAFKKSIKEESAAKEAKDAMFTDAVNNLQELKMLARDDHKDRAVAFSHSVRVNSMLAEISSQTEATKLNLDKALEHTAAMREHAKETRKDVRIIAIMVFAFMAGRVVHYILSIWGSML